MKTRKYTILRGRICKVHRNWTSNKIMQRLPLLTSKNKYKYLSSDIVDKYIFINKSHYPMRC